jgi:hypothetical protein
MEQLAFPFVETRKCSRCGVIQPLSEFFTFTLQSGKKAPYSYCRSCRRRGIPDPVLEERKNLFAEGLRRCRYCKEIKTLDCFYIDKVNHTDGYLTICKECFLEKQAPGSRKRKKKREKWYKEQQELESENKRRCIKCKKIYSLNDFYIDVNNYREPRCKYCIREQQSPGAAERKKQRKKLRKQGLKECSRCKQIKPHTEFYIDGERPGHFLPKCKPCFYEMSQDWESRNPTKVATYWRKRRAKKHGAEGKHTVQDISKLYKRQDGCCIYHGLNPRCHGELADSYHADHIIPLTRGGSNWPDNIQLLCPHCNISKGNKTHEEYVSWLKEVYELA